MVITEQAGRDRVAVLEWRAWAGFLLTHVLGDHAARIEVDPFCEFPSGQFERICDSFTTVCFQINLSVRRRLPLRIRDLTNRFESRGLHVINGQVQDVRKSTLHAHLAAIGLSSLKASPSGDADEILFIKTDLNYGGDLERWLPPESIAAAGLEHLVSTDIGGAYHYRTVERGALQEGVWTDPAIVVEKYVTNAESSFYRVYFSGKRIIIVQSFSLGIIKKMSGDPRNTNFLAELDNLKAAKDKLPISATLKRDIATFVENSPVEFGCIDMVHDGYDHHYIVDLNLTPYAGNRTPDPELIEFLRAGITDQRKSAVSVRTPLA